MRDFARELDDALALAADLLGSVMAHLMEKEYGPHWFEKELRPRMLRGEGERTGGRYSAFVREHGEVFAPEDMDVTVCASVLLNDEKYMPLARAYGDRAVDALEGLRAARNDVSHASQLTWRERLALAGILFGNMALCASAFSLRRFDSALDEQLDRFAEKLTGGPGPGARDDPYERQLVHIRTLVSQGQERKAVQLCTELAENRHVPAMLYLARMYCDGTVTPDYPRALGWLNRAAKAGSDEAAVLRVRLRELMEQLSRAKTGDAAALFSLGRAFETGDLVEKNQHKAYEYYHRAIEAGSLLAESYVQGRFEEHDMDAVYLKARLGDKEAQKLLARAQRAEGESIV